MSEDERSHAQKRITVREMNEFLERREIRPLCQECGSPESLIAAEPGERGQLYEFAAEVLQPPGIDPLAYLAVICGSCGHTRFFLKGMVRSTLDMIAEEGDENG